MHPCSCIEGCREKNKAICTLNKDTRNSCRFCRYIKCRSAGMVKEWVLSAYLEKDKDAEKISIEPKLANKRVKTCAVETDTIKDNNQNIFKTHGSRYTYMILDENIQALIKKDTLCECFDRTVHKSIFQSYPEIRVLN